MRSSSRTERRPRACRCGGAEIIAAHASVALQVAAGAQLRQLTNRETEGQSVKVPSCQNMGNAHQAHWLEVYTAVPASRGDKQAPFVACNGRDLQHVLHHRLALTAACDTRALNSRGERWRVYTAGIHRTRASSRLTNTACAAVAAMATPSRARSGRRQACRKWERGGGGGGGRGGGRCGRGRCAVHKAYTQGLRWSVHCSINGHPDRRPR